MDSFTQQTSDRYANFGNVSGGSASADASVATWRGMRLSLPINAVVRPMSVPIDRTDITGR